ncbi:MAG: hypothetical protein ABIN67_17840 [Ferruginibacter sp.]
MKQKIKKLSIFFLLMILFNTSQEKECLSLKKCVTAAPIASQEAADEMDAASYDELEPLSPISRFIIMKY